MDVLKSMSILIDQPFFALAPSGLFLAAYAASKSRWAFAAGALWFLYCFYELAMKYRLMCSGECNIRIDLLLLYPVLLVISVVAAVAVVRALSMRRELDD